jgi:CheY-like chemotaxis protein
MKRRILTIDDNPALRQFIQRTLTKKLPSHALSFACAGAEGLGMAGCEKPDLILLDFSLPDIAGGEVCRGLQADPETAELPVILMGGPADELKRSQSEFDNIVQTIPKPFTADQLCHAVTKALRNATSPAATGNDTSSGAMAMESLGQGKDLFTLPAPRTPSKYAGDTGATSLMGLLLELERDSFSGKLTIKPNEAPAVELHLSKGRPTLAITRDAAAYLACSGHKLTPKQEPAMERLRAEQAKTGNPIFLLFAEEKLMPRRKALALCLEQNQRLFAALWTARRAKFSFEANAPEPSLASGMAPFDGQMTEWALESFKLVGRDLTAERESGKLFSLF